MRYADCYMNDDEDGSPTSTYRLNVPKAVLDKAISQLNDTFDRVVLTDTPKGKSAIPLSEITRVDSAPTLQNAMRGARA